MAILDVQTWVAICQSVSILFHTFLPFSHPLSFPGLWELSSYSPPFVSCLKAVSCCRVQVNRACWSWTETTSGTTSQYKSFLLSVSGISPGKKADYDRTSNSLVIRYLKMCLPNFFILTPLCFMVRHVCINSSSSCLIYCNIWNKMRIIFFPKKNILFFVLNDNLGKWPMSLQRYVLLLV